MKFAPDRQAAQCFARIATRIFNQWNALPHTDPEDDDFELNNLIVQCITKLERSYEVVVVYLVQIFKHC